MKSESRITEVATWSRARGAACVVECLVGLVVVGLGAGCGGRSDAWDRGVGQAQAFGLTDAVAVAAPEAERVLLLPTDADRHRSRCRSSAAFAR